MSRDPGVLEVRTKLSSLSLQKRLGWCQMAIWIAIGQVTPSTPKTPQHRP